MIELLGRNSYLTVVSISYFAVNALAVNREELPYGHYKYDYPIMNASWCLDLGQCCPLESRSDKFVIMLTDFCLDRYYGFMSVRDAGIDEEKERAEFTGPRIYTDAQIDRIVEAVTDALAENNDTKKAFLKNPLFYCPYREVDRCYWKVYKIFALLCLDPVKNHHARLCKHIFVHVCEADWLDLRRIANITKSTCAKKEDIMRGGDESPA